MQEEKDDSADDSVDTLLTLSSINVGMGLITLYMRVFARGRPAPPAGVDRRKDGGSSSSSVSMVKVDASSPSRVVMVTVAGVSGPVRSPGGQDGDCDQHAVES